MSSCVAVIASLTDAKAVARSVLQNVDMHVISVRLIGTRPEGAMRKFMKRNS
jgi:hypothetical protein